MKKFFTSLFGAQHEIQRKLNGYLDDLNAMTGGLRTALRRLSAQG